MVISTAKMSKSKDAKAAAKVNGKSTPAKKAAPSIKGFFKPKPKSATKEDAKDATSSTAKATAPKSPTKSKEVTPPKSPSRTSPRKSPTRSSTRSKSPATRASPRKTPAAKAPKSPARTSPRKSRSKSPVAAKSPAKSPTKTPAKSPAKANDSLKSPAKITLPTGETSLTAPCPTIGTGWTQQIIARKFANGKISKSSDRYYFSPNGKKFRSIAEVTRFLDSGEEDKVEEVGSGKKKGRKSRTPAKKAPAKKAKKAEKVAEDAEESEEEVKKTPAKKPKKKTTASSTKAAARKSKPKFPTGTAVSKVFHDEDEGEERPFSGKIISFDGKEKVYSVEYEDGDEEEMNEEEVGELVAAAEENAKKSVKKGKRSKASKKDSDDEEDSDEEVVTKKKKARVSKKAPKEVIEDSDEEMEDEDAEDTPPAKTTASGRPSRRSATKKVVYAVESDDDEEMEFEDSEEEAPKKKKAKGKLAKANAAKGKKSKGSKKFIADSDSEDFELGSDAEEDESLKDDTESEADSSEDGAPKKRGKKAVATTKKPVAKKSNKQVSGIKKAKPENGSIEALCKAKAKDIKVLNNPQQFPADGPYVEPVGIDATDGIVEGIIGGMVQKVGKLLLEAIGKKDEEREKGELKFPLQLNTACSGTDAPSIALGLVQESLDRFTSQPSGKKDGKDDEKEEKHGFCYEHNMSCEIEPFKQAYIGRNFPGVLLFPDITKLTEKETVVDVYGREQQIPTSNIFVAGTSCKDFSMLKSSHRKDIEDKGTSGETFLAAVEYLEQEQPAVALFENVDKAPWEKMQEYIQGRLHLSERNSIKNITEIKKEQADADNELKFSIDEDGKYVVEEVPRQVGVKAGNVVKGFVRGDDDPNNVQPLSTSPKKAGKIVTLGKIARDHGIELEEDILVMEKKARYCTHLIRLDTKHYGLPQTRNRQYLFVWRSDDASDDLGEYFQLLMDHLKTPLLHSMEAFMLPPTHDRIRCFREALRSGPGLMVAKERSKELDFFDWDLSSVKDLAHHLNYRSKMGIEERSRWLTQWKTRGRKSVAPGLWPELVAMWNMRRCDLIDCFSASVARDTISRDPLHHSFTWDLSQNVHRTSVRTPTVGVSGCVTPGGELLLPNKGRTMMGFEKLLLQGIPFTRLALGPETEVQLSDLAGNAMSMPVVCATLLSAICAPELRRMQKRIEKVNLRDYVLPQKYDSANGAVLAERGDLHCRKNISTKDFEEVFADIANELSEEAFGCSVLCNSETSGQTSQDDKILECTQCGFGISHSYTSSHQIESHDFKEVQLKKRANPHEFEMRLRCAAPSVLVLGEGWEEAIPDAQGLESYTFQLQRVDRNRGHWLLTYGAWEDQGSGRQVAEIRVLLGRVGTLEKDMGLAAYVKCFSPAIRLQNPKRGVLGDVARLILRMKDGSITKESATWKMCAKPTKAKLEIIGSNPCDSYRVESGLTDTAAKELKNHKPMKKFTQNFPESRNHQLHYHPKWKTWPGTLEISGNELVNGTYEKMSCKHTVVLSALWRREATDSAPAMYLYFRPDVMRTGLDVAVISPTPSYRDCNMEVCEIKDWIPENALVEKTHETDAKFLNWEPAAKLKLEVPTPTMVAETSDKPFNEQMDSETMSDGESPMLCEMSGLSKEVMKSLLQHSDITGGGNIDDANSEIVPIDLIGKMGSRNAKRLSILAAPALLKYAAEGKLPMDLLRWYELSHPEGCAFGTSQSHFPSRPEEKWKEVEGKARGKKVVKFEREFDAEESNDFYHKLLQRPPVFEASVNKALGKLVLRMNPIVAGHQAAAHLVRARGLGDNYAKSVKVDYCLSELSSMGEPLTKEFHVGNSDSYEETTVEGMELPLYPRQAKALTRMLNIESGNVPFHEEERSEHILNGVGWCLIGRATKTSPLKGGVLGDAIGSGKTVVTIALILNGIEKARSESSVEEGRSGATLIVVPPGLVQQWDDERKKFTKSKLKSIIIDSTSTLTRFSVQEICEADIVIVPAGLIEERGKTATSRPYTELLSAKADAEKIPPAPTSGHKEAPTIEGTWVRNMASGPAIYVGNNSKQKHRDEQAFYGHRYSSAIKKLRSQKFKGSERGVPLEWFTWNRIVVDECHECLVSSAKQDQVSRASDFKAQARRGAREFLGVGCTDSSSRPLVAKEAIWGLTGTPLLETEARVTELANLMGGTYLTGSAHHWRKEERESGRDIFLNQQEEGSKSREYRCAIQESCHAYVREACQRNRGEQLAVKLDRKQNVVNMSPSDGEKFLKAIKDSNLESYSITPDQLGDKASNGLSVTASSSARHSALFDIIGSIQASEPRTKIIIFANAVYGGYESALSALKSSDHKFSHVGEDHTVLEQNEIISWFRHTDATEEDRSRPRILLLSFSQAAGHNLQEACHNVIMYDPMYSGSDAVADASVEEQALGRVMRQGQTEDVTCYRILVKGPDGERCLDDIIVERNLDEDVLRAATSNFD